MILYVVVPRLVGAAVEDRKKLGERERFARAHRAAALSELATLKNAGYEVIGQEVQVMDNTLSDVFLLEDKTKKTQVDPSASAWVG